MDDGQDKLFADAPRKRRRASATEHQALVDFFLSAWRDRKRETYPFTSRDGRAAKAILAARPADWRTVIIRYLDSSDPLASRRKHPLFHLADNLPQFVVGVTTRARIDERISRDAKDRAAAKAIAQREADEMRMQLARLSASEFEHIARRQIAEQPEFNRHRLERMPLDQMLVSDFVRQLVYAEVKARQKERAATCDGVG